MSEMGELQRVDGLAATLAEWARLTQLLAERGVTRMPLIELRRLLQLEGIKLATLDLDATQQAALPALARLAYDEICRRLLPGNAQRACL